LDYVYKIATFVIDIFEGSTWDGASPVLPPSMPSSREKSE
jgi:hypothetical protein